MTTGKPGSARHGTMPGYNRHIRLRETVCPACRACQNDWGRARWLRVKSGFRLSMADALTQLGLPPDRIPAGAPEDAACPVCGLPLVELPGRCPDCGGPRIVHADTRTGAEADRLWDCHAVRCGQGHLMQLAAVS